MYIYLFTEFGDTKLVIFDKLRGKIPSNSFKEYMMAYIKELKKLESSDNHISYLKREFLNACPQHIKKAILKLEIPKSLKLFKEVIESYVDKGEFRKDLDCSTAAYVTVMSISNLEYYDDSNGGDIMNGLINVIDFLFQSMND